MSVEGFGYWSGRDVRIEFRPAPENAGLVFVQSDLPRPIRIPALVSNRVESPRRTTLVRGGGRVEMVEHVLAACAGLQVDNCEIWLDEPELPGGDGSSTAFTAALQQAGIIEQTVERSQLIVRETIRVGDDERWIEARPARDGLFTVRYELDYESCPAIGRQIFEMGITPVAFERELAAARTFLLKSEADWLRSRGLGTRVTARDLLVFDDAGPIDNELRYDNECVRHKILDVVGDLALAGCDIVGQVVAHRSGHQLNAGLVSAIVERYSITENRKTA